jgi:alkaline phosphatase D
MPLSRRNLIASSVVAGAAVAVPTAAWADRRDHGSLQHDPFTLGVASGDPQSDGFVLWTRLAPDPLARDGMGGMPDRNVDVDWQVARDERFKHIVADGTKTARPEWGHTVHVEVTDLEPGREYFYRFRVDHWHSPAARTRTTPSRRAMPSALTMAVVSCANYEHGYFNAYGHLASEYPDLIVHLGDYYYDYHADQYVAPGGNVRDHLGPETASLANYRQRHAQYKLDLDLQAAHAVAPFISVFDDHEIDNNWADEFYEKPQFLRPFFKQRREAAFRAYYENMPLRRSSIPDGIDMQLYRRLHWGRLAAFHMMDTRQYRDDQACGDYWQNCSAAYDPARTITGDAQEEWLIDGFHDSQARWDILGQQVFFAQRDADAGPLKSTHMDVWDGYVASRQRVTEGWVDAGVRNPVVLTGDVHSSWANELKLDYDDPTGPSVGVELVSTSLSSGGNGMDSIPEDSPFLKINPHIKFYNGQRGYIMTRLTPDQLEADFKVVPNVRTPDSTVYTRRSYTVVDGDPTLYQTYSRQPDGPLEVFGEDPLENSHENDDDLVS